MKSIRWSPLFALLLATMAFAGCVGEDAEPKGEDTPPPTSASTGAVRGKVLTADLEPVANGLVGLLQDDTVVQEVRTDTEGAYLLGDVAPGAYRLQVTALCCRATMKMVDIEADQVAVVDLQLVRLSSDDLRSAYVEAQEWSGFVSCGVSTIAVRAAACALAEDTPMEDPNEEFMKRFNVSKGLKTLVVAMEWDPVGGVSGQTFNLLIENDDCGVRECTYRYADLEGAPPLVMHIDDEGISDPAWLWDVIEGQRGLQFRVFAGGDNTVVYQQPFKVYHHAFYWEPAPADYNPIPDE